MKLNAIETIQNGVQLGLKSFPALVVNGILYGLTVWIPYLNIGTTIAMINLPARIARDESLSMTEIFDPKYRENFGEVFLAMGLVTAGLLAGFSMFFFPAYILSIAWSLAVLLVIDKKLEPMAALRKSFELTNGNKWAIWLSSFLFLLAVGIGAGVLNFIGGLITPLLGKFFVLVIMILIVPIRIGIAAEIYKKLTSNG